MTWNEIDLPPGPIERSDLTVGVILDSFSELALRYEWHQITFGPDDWRTCLSANKPDMLFVESSWNGNGGRWRLHMTRNSRPSNELRELIGWCNQAGIPTAFWNKEDPPNYDRFIETAKLFDHVFTVDADRIPHYLADLGHNRVSLLPFAAQPRIHNPVRRGAGTVYDVAFAGTYFAEKHESRRRQMEFMLEPALESGLHIYSRLQGNDERYRFPQRYEQHIMGSLKYEQMLSAYTAYKVFLNVNSVTESPTMCARRLFELSAAQTAVLSAPAAAISEFFGDEISVAQSREQSSTQLSILLKQDEFRERKALRAHRTVFDKHLYRHRVDSILQEMGLGETHVTRPPYVSVVVPSNRPHQLENIFSFIGRQAHEHVQLVLVTHGFEPSRTELARLAECSAVSNFQIRVADPSLTLGECMNLGVDASDGQYVAKMDDDNWYSANYLKDLVRAFTYTDAQVVGKWAHFVHLESSNATLLRFEHAEHRHVRLVQGGTIVAERSLAQNVKFDDIPRRVDTTFLDKVRARGGLIYSTDRFNFVSMRRSSPGQHTWNITDQELMDGKARVLFYGQPYDHAEV